MALTVDQLTKARDDLIAACASGAKVYRDQNGGQIVFKDDHEMRSALAALDRLIAEAGGRAMPRTILVKTSKGL